MFVKRKSFFLVIAAIILPLAFLAILRCTALESGETCVDSYYHMALAETGPSLFMGKTFPHMTMSSWENNFSDKELVYHLILSGICSWSSLLGLDNNAPFHFPALFFAAVMLLAFVYAAFKFGIKNVWFYSIALACISPAFTYRILMLRPHLLGITLLILAAYFSSKTKSFKDLYALSLLGFAASWSYSNPHFIVIPVSAFALFTFMQNKKLALSMPIAALLGVLAGLLIHPQFPNTFITWKIQCVDVMLEILSRNKSVFIADEFAGASLMWFRENIFFVLLFIFNLIIFSILAAKNKLRGLSVPLKASFLLSLITFAGIAQSIRTVEYACPFTVLATGLMMTEFQNTATVFKPLRKISFTVLSIIIMLSANYTAYIYSYCVKSITFKTPEKFAEWIKKTGIPQGTVIANLCWSDFPLLYYSLPQYRYLVGIDPMFAYSKTPEATKKLEAFRTGRLKLSPEQLATLTNANFAYVSAYGWKLAEGMSKNGYKLLYQDENGYFFILNEAAVK